MVGEVNVGFEAKLILSPHSSLLIDSSKFPSRGQVANSVEASLIINLNFRDIQMDIDAKDEDACKLKPPGQL